jgi:hypothetical protein
MNTRLLSLVFAVLSTASTFATPPLGTFVYEFNATNNPVWDLSGPLDLNQEIIGTAGSTIPLGVPITLDQNVKGRLAGSGFTSVLVDTNVLTARYRVQGKVYTAANKTKVRFNVRATGRDIIAGVTNSFRILLVYQLELDPATRLLSGTVRGSAKFSALLNGRVHQETELTLPASIDGSWVLTLDLNSTTPPGGNAAITLANGRFLQYFVRGSHSESRDATRVGLRGFGNGLGSKLSLRLASTNAILTDLGGRILGQKLDYPLPQTSATD